MMSASMLCYSETTERQKPVLCSQFTEIVTNLENNFGEKLEFVVTNQIYRNFITNIAMYRNSKTGSWTIVEFSEDPIFLGEGCILGSGRESSS